MVHCGECRGVVGVGCGNCVVAVSLQNSVTLSLCRIDQELTLLWHTNTMKYKPTISNPHCACTEG